MPGVAGRAGGSDSRAAQQLAAGFLALLPLLTALRDWSDEWVFGRGHEPVIVKDRRSNRRIPRLRVTDAEGRPLTRRDLRTEPGPGASSETMRLLTRARA